MKKKLWLVIDYNTSPHQQLAGAPCRNMISFCKTDDEIKAYLDKTKAQGESNVAWPMETQKDRDIACRSCRACKWWVKDSAEFLCRRLTREGTTKDNGLRR